MREQTNQADLRRPQGRKSRARRRQIRRRGTELLELGLVLGLILLPIMFGTVEFGTYFYVEHNLQAAAREGARAGCVFDPATDAAKRDDAVRSAVENVLSHSSLTSWKNFDVDKDIDFSIDTTVDDNNQQYCTVTVETTWDKIPDGMRPMMMIRNPQNHKLRGYAAMRVEK